MWCIIYLDTVLKYIKRGKSMKKLTSILLSAIIMLTAVVGFDLTAYAGSYDTTAKAKSYTLGTTTTGYFSSNDRIDFLKVDVPQSGRIDFTMEDSDDGYYIRIYSSKNLDDYVNSDVISISYNSNLGKAYGTDYIYLVAGTYYFRVCSQYYNQSSNYTLTTSFTSANESFPESLDVNNNIIGNANPISLDTTYNGMLGENDDVDFYKFNVTADAVIVNLKSEKEISFRIYTLTGEEVTSTYYSRFNSSTNTATTSETISLSNGTYCLKLWRGYYDKCFYSFSINSPHQHSYNYAYTVKSTYTSQGYDVYTCSCGASYTTNYKAVKKLGKVNLKSVSSARKNHKIKASWDKKSGANGYQIYYSRNKNFKNFSAKKIVKGGKTTSYVGKNFTKGRKYYVKVRAYKNVNGRKIYGKWSNVKTVKCK